ncbi:MAG: hypothetical protein KDE58_29605 [Caldilineaceae bacterium]|nr:hypothetical protein [Caldilineaceae bacterium]
MNTLTFHCEIEQIADWHPHLFLEPHIVACVAVLSQYSRSPAILEVDCTDIVCEWLGQESQFRLEISWTEELAAKAERLRFTMQSKSLVELSAIALASILVSRIVLLGQLDVTNYGERADYRSVDVPSVLEISGTESLSEITRRHREKIAQALENPLGLDAYVVICGFSDEKHRIRFSYHRWQHSSEV